MKRAKPMQAARGEKCTASLSLSPSMAVTAAVTTTPNTQHPCKELLNEPTRTCHLGVGRTALFCMVPPISCASFQLNPRPPRLFPFFMQTWGVGGGDSISRLATIVYVDQGGKEREREKRRSKRVGGKAYNKQGCRVVPVSRPSAVHSPSLQLLHPSPDLIVYSFSCCAPLSLSPRCLIMRYEMIQNCNNRVKTGSANKGCERCEKKERNEESATEHKTHKQMLSTTHSRHTLTTHYISTDTGAQGATTRNPSDP
jgi:hypothetical protein